MTLYRGSKSKSTSCYTLISQDLIMGVCRETCMREWHIFTIVKITLVPNIILLHNAIQKIKFKQHLIFIIHNSACLMMMKNDHFIPLRIFSWALFDCILMIKNYRSSMIIPHIAQANMFNVDTSQKTIVNQFLGKLTLYLPFSINGFDITIGFILFCVIMI